MPPARSLAIATLLGLVAIGGAGSAPAAGTSTTPKLNIGDDLIHYSGRIASSTGRYANRRGAVKIDLIVRAVGRSDEPNPPDPDTIEMTLRAPACSTQRVAPKRRCIRLRGVLPGTSPPIVPPAVSSIRYGFIHEVHASGRVSSFGQATVTGRRELLILEEGAKGRIQHVIRIKLREPRGSITISAKAPVESSYYP